MDDSGRDYETEDGRLHSVWYWLDVIEEAVNNLECTEPEAWASDEVWLANVLQRRLRRLSGAGREE